MISLAYTILLSSSLFQRSASVPAPEQPDALERFALKLIAAEELEEETQPEQKPVTKKKNVFKRVCISRFVKVSYTYLPHEYDRTSVNMAEMDDDEWYDFMEDRLLMREDYEAWKMTWNEEYDA